MFDLNQLLDLPAAALLSAADNKLILVTIQHEHADRLTIERQHLGTSIDIADLMQRIGNAGPVPAETIRVSEVPVPQLPSPPDTAGNRLLCPHCDKTFTTPQGRGSHIHAAHKPQADAPTTAPTLIAVTPDAPSIVAPSIEGICGVCNTSIRLHDRCEDCTALLGPDHEAGGKAGQVKGQPLCASCASFRKAAVALGVAA